MDIIRYSREELFSFLPPKDDVKVAREVRKTLFTHKIWNPRQVRSRVYNELNGNKDQAIRRQSPVKLGLLNARSAVNKAALIQDSLCDGALYIFVLTETWITSDAPSWITNSLAPDGFNTTHQHRGSSTDKRGGGIAVIHRQDIKSSKIDHDFSRFESLHLKFSTRKSSFIVSSIYRPPGPITSSFITEFEDLDANDYAILLNNKLETLLDKHAPVKKRSVRVGQHPNNQLSNEAIEAKKCCRRMERLYHSKETGAAKQAYKSAKEAAKLAILNSKAYLF